MRTKALALGLAAVLAVSCSDSATSPTLSDAGPQPAFEIGNPGWLNGPFNPGSSGVFRLDTSFGDVFFVWTEDPNRNLITGWYDVPNGALFGCGPEPFEPSAVQYNASGGAVLRALASLKDVPIYVYDLEADPGSDLCAFFANGWLYRGTASIIYTDNDYFVSGTRANSYGWRGQGKVCDQDGYAYNYHEVQKAQILPDGTDRWIVEDIKITGPLGGGAEGCD